MALFFMRSRKAPGLNTVSFDYVKEWYKLSHPELEEEEVYTSALNNWGLVFAIFQECFISGTPPSSFRFGTLVIIPKDEKGSMLGI